MTKPTVAVQIRRINYGILTKPLTAVLYDDDYDSLLDTNVLDAVMRDNPQWTITGYHWDGTHNVAN